MRDEYDVVVAGGGPAGFPAAVQAARLGARTLLVEKNGALGGTTTVAGVALPGLFHAWGEQIIAGIGWDAVRHSAELAGIDLPDFTAWELPHFKLQVPVVPAIYAAVLDETVLSAGCDLRLHSMIAEVGRIGTDDSDGWEVTVCGKEGLQRVRTAALVDATGDADLVAHAGLPRLRNAARQPGTLMVRLGGYDPADLDYDALEAAYEKAVAAGDIYPADLAHNDVRTFLRRRGENAIHVTGVDGGSSELRTMAEVAARRTLLRIVAFFRRQPGLGGLTVANWAVECGIRETFTIDGRARITAADYTTGRRWDDALSYSFYPVDIHRPDGDGIDIRPLSYGTLPTIPRAAMVPKGASTLVVAGRAVSGDQEANSAYRVQASCMAMGQAAGVLAARVAEVADRRTGALELELDDIRSTLREQGAIVPGDVEIGAAHAH